MSKTQMREYIHSLRGSLKRKPGEKSVVQELIEERRAEKKKEDREFKSVGKEIKINWLAK